MTGIMDGPAAPAAEPADEEGVPAAPRRRPFRAPFRGPGSRGLPSPPPWNTATVLRNLSEPLGVTAPAVLLAVLAWSHRWITDDGLIAARTVRQILAGNGPVFNQGERVEANTSALWTWLTAGEAWVTGIDVYTVFLWTGLVLAPLGLIFAQLGTLRLLRSRGAWGARRAVPFGAVIIAVLPPFWDFTTSGLETSLVLFWLGLSWWLLAGAAKGRLAFRAAVLGLGWVVRPDMAIASAIFLAVLLRITWTRPRRVVGLLAAAAAVPGAYEVFRMGYYGLIVPNTALTKEAEASNFAQGLTYLGNFTGPYSLWLPALCGAAVALAIRPWRGMSTANRLVLAAGAGCGLLMGIYVIYIGGDFMHARMLLPATFTLLLPVMTVPLPRALDGRGVAAALALAGTAGWAVICAFSLRLEQKPWVIPPDGIVNERVYWMQRTGAAHPTDPGPYLQMVGGSTDPATSLRQHARTLYVGSLPMLYLADPDNNIVTAVPLGRGDVPVAMSGELLGTLGAMVPLDGLAVDDHGLSYAVGSHLDVNGLRIGHQKSTSITWLLADYTAVPTGAVSNGGAVDTARVDLGCGSMATLQRATRGPLGVGDFFRNVWDSYALTGLRVSNDPVYAQDDLCR